LGEMDSKAEAPLISEAKFSQSLPGEESVLLPDGRTLSYSQSGDLTSSRIILFLHGVFGVGVADHSAFYQKLGYRCLCPTLPGWGTSSPWPRSLPLSAYASDISFLLKHVMAETPLRDLVLGGGSYGTIWAYAAAANKPPAHLAKIEPEGIIKGLLILGGFSPFKEHKGYTEQMTWMNWFTVSRPSLWWPLRLIHPLVGRVIASKVKGNIDGSLTVLRQIITGPKAMKPEERNAVETWARGNGSSFEEWEWKMARNMSLSLLHYMDGYSLVPTMLNADWGFKLHEIQIGRPNAAQLLPTLHTVPLILPPVVVVGAQRDHLCPLPLQRYVAAQIPGAQLIELPGNHISVVTALSDLVTALLNVIS